MGLNGLPKITVFLLIHSVPSRQYTAWWLHNKLSHVLICWRKIAQEGLYLLPTTGNLHAKSDVSATAQSCVVKQPRQTLSGRQAGRQAGRHARTHAPQHTHTHTHTHTQRERDGANCKFNYHENREGAQFSQLDEYTVLTSHNHHRYEPCNLQPRLPEWHLNNAHRRRHWHVVLLHTQKQFLSLLLAQT